AGTSSNGIFKSLDGGATWAALGAGLPGARISAILLVPSTTVIYAGVDGDGTDSGVYKSTNGGATWAASNNGIRVFIAPRSDYRSSDRILSLAQASDGSLYAGSGSTVYRSADGAASWTLPSVSFPLGPVRAVLSDPINPNTLYITSSSYSRGVLKSTDAGRTFGESTLAVDVATIARARAGTFFVGTNGAGIYKSTDGGTSWTGALGGLPPADATGVAIIPGHASAVYLATAGAGLLKTLDGGVSWTRTGYGAGTVCSVAVDPLTSTTAYLINDYGDLYKSTDDGQTWQKLRGTGFTEPSTYSDCNYASAVVVDPGQAATLYVSAFDSATSSSHLLVSVNGGASWSSIPSVAGVLSAMAFDPLDGRRRYVLTDRAFYGSEGGGASFAPITARTGCCSSIAVAAGAVLVAGMRSSDDVYRSADRGTTWSKVIERSNYLGPGAQVSVNPLNSTDVVAATASPFPYGCCTTFDVFRSLDGGMGWQSLGTGLPAGSVAYPTAVQIVPSGAAYLATSVGLYTNAGDGPRIAAVLPRTGSPLGGTNVTIAGANFVSRATVKFGATAAASVVVSPTLIRATTAAGSGAVDVTVTNPDTQASTLPGGFTFGCFYSASLLKVTTVAASGRPSERINISGYIGPQLEATTTPIPICGGLAAISDRPWIGITVPPDGPRVGYPWFTYLDRSESVRGGTDGPHHAWQHRLYGGPGRYEFCRPLRRDRYSGGAYVGPERIDGGDGLGRR
ncbi:MAG: IPT/TIG domain-containing protein, partial [Pseudolysinimonas sp.]